MKISEKCFVCGKQMVGLPHNKQYIMCEMACTQIEEDLMGNHIIFFFKDSFYIKNDEGIGLRFNYYEYDDEIDYSKYKNSLFEIECSKIPIEIQNTYSLSEYLISFITQINKVKAFL